MKRSLIRVFGRKVLIEIEKNFEIDSNLKMVYPANRTIFFEQKRCVLNTRFINSSDKLVAIKLELDREVRAEIFQYNKTIVYNKQNE